MLWLEGFGLNNLLTPACQRLERSDWRAGNGPFFVHFQTGY